MTLKFVSVLFLIVIAPWCMNAQTNSCESGDNFKKLDFWIGNWEVKNPQGQVSGHNKITKILDGCALLEEWSGSSGSRGKSLNFYNPQMGKWEQIWVDNFANPLHFTGVAGRDSMTYSGTSLNAGGGQIFNEMILSKITENKVRQLWRQSSDQGATWNVVFDGTYLRHD